MFANNLSTLGVSAAQLDNKLDTQSYTVTWMSPGVRCSTVNLEINF
jgi:hypothetical protein